jgi:hypothetical protein
MLYRIARDGVPHYLDGQTPLVYLESTIGDVLDANLRWVFSDGNCGAALTEYHDDLGELDSAIDWPLQAAWDWRNTADDPSRMTRRAAEFLVHRAMPWPVIRRITVRDKAIAVTVRDLLATMGERREIRVIPSWYYAGDKYH